MVVVRTGSIRAAALQLGVAQSAISRQVQMLEHELGTPAMERNTRGVRLTPAGELLYRRAQDTAFKIERFQSEFDELRGLKRGHVQFSSIESLTSHLLPVVLAAWHRKHPAVTVAVTIGTTETVIRHVTDGLASFGVCFSASPSSGVQIVARFREPLLVVLPREHPLRGRSRLALADLRSHSVALSTRTTGVGLLIELACRRAGVVLPAALETNSIELIRRFVSHGAGIAIMTRQGCLEALDAGEITAVPLRDEAFEGTSVDFITMQGRSLPLPAERVMEELQFQLAGAAVPGLDKAG